MVIQRIKSLTLALLLLVAGCAPASQGVPISSPPSQVSSVPPLNGTLIASALESMPEIGFAAPYPGTGQIVSGVDTSNGVHPLLVDTSGKLQVNSSGGGSSTVAIDQTTPGSTNGVQTLSGSVTTATLGAGSAIAGKVGIDQTTPGTTNGVQVNAALPAGTNSIGTVVLGAGSALAGKVGIDQTTPGTTNGVQVNAALPAGTNNIGAASTGALIPNGATQKISSNTFSAGASSTASTIPATSSQFSCLEQAIVHMDISTAVVTGDVTISDGTWTVHVRCVDTTNAGAWCPYDGPVLQSTAVNTTITVTVPAMTNGGAGDAMAIGYTRAGGC